MIIMECNNLFDKVDHACTICFASTMTYATLELAILKYGAQIGFLTAKRSQRGSLFTSKPNKFVNHAFKFGV